MKAAKVDRPASRATNSSNRDRQPMAAYRRGATSMLEMGSTTQPHVRKYFLTAKARPASTKKMRLRREKGGGRGRGDG
jgi:hypothetical protein